MSACKYIKKCLHSSGWCLNIDHVARFCCDRWKLHKAEELCMWLAYKLIKEHRDALTPQQQKTLKGQCRAGDIEGAIKGLYRILRRNQ